MDASRTRLSLLAGLLLLSCEGDGGGAGGGGEGVDGACAALAESVCGRVAECAPVRLGIGLWNGRSFGSEMGCVERFALACATWVDLADGRLGPGALSDCAGTIEAAPCHEAILAFESDPPACAAPLGDRGEGEGCLSGLQCASGYCDPGNESCGVCAPRPSWLDVSKGAEGEGCDNEDQCSRYLRCVEGECAPGGDLGAACADTSECHEVEALSCGGGWLCEERAIAAADEACSPYEESATGVTAACGAGLDCVNPNDLGTGHCEAYAEDGGACDSYEGPFCLFPATCLGGVCVVPSASTCSP